MTVQREIPVLSEARSVDLVEPRLIEACPTAHQALLLQIQLSGLTDETVCDQLGIDKGHFSRIRSGTAHFPTRKLSDLQRLCGNAALAQWLARDAGFELRAVDRQAERIRLLEAEIQRMRAGA